MTHFLTSVEAAHYRVLVLAGQSNAVGNAVRPTDLDDHSLLKTQPDIPFRYWLRNAMPTAAAYTSNDSTVLGVQIVGADNSPFPWSVNGTYGGFGPEIKIGRTIKDRTGWNVMVVKVAAGGSAMGNATSAAGQDLWKVGGLLHARLITEIHGALAQLQARGHTAEVAGFFWVQGESDARKDTGEDRTENALAYEHNLAELVANIRQTFNNPQMPAVIARVDPEDIPAWGQYFRTNADIVRAAIMNYAANNPLAEWVNVDDLPRRKSLEPSSPDIIHYVYTGQLMLGDRMAQAYLRLLQPAVGAPCGKDRVSFRKEKSGHPHGEGKGHPDLLDVVLDGNRTVAEAELPCGSKSVSARAMSRVGRPIARNSVSDIVRSQSLGLLEVADIFRCVLCWWSRYLNAACTADTLPGSTQHPFEWSTRMLVPMAAWLSQPGRSMSVTWNNVTVDVAETLRKALVNGSDPAHPDRWPIASASSDQIVVEAPQVAYATWLLYQAKLAGAPGGAVWDSLTSTQRSNINSFLANTARDTYTTYPHNWNMFIVISHEVRKRLQTAGVSEFSGWSQTAMDTCRKNLQDRHKGGGWYSDNALRNVHDDYTPWAILPDQMVAYTIGAGDTQAQTVIAGTNGRGRAEILADIASWLAGHPLQFDAKGRNPEFGRSTTYKFGRLRGLTTAYYVDRFYSSAWGVSPYPKAEVPPGLLRRPVRLHLGHYLANGTLDPETGELRNGQTLESAACTMEPYISNGSRFWAMMSLVPLLQLPDNDPLWSAAEVSLPSENYAYEAWFQKPGLLFRHVPDDHHVELFNGRCQRGSWTDDTYIPRYGKYVYSSQIGHCLSSGSPYDQSISIGSYRRDNPSSASYIVPGGTPADQPGVLRTTLVQGNSANQEHYTVKTLIFFKGPVHVRVSRIIGAAGQPVREGGYAPGHRANEIPPAVLTGVDWAYMESSTGAAFIARLLGYGMLQQVSGTGNHTRSALWRLAYAEVASAPDPFDCAVLVRGSARRFDPDATRALVSSLQINGKAVTIQWSDDSSTTACFE